jgi:hypothetical protein
VTGTNFLVRLELRPAGLEVSAPRYEASDRWAGCVAAGA